MPEISFIQKGKGKPLLFLHGYLSSKEAFTAQIRYFSKFYRVVALDFLGFGESGALVEPFSVGDYAEWLLGVMGKLGVERPHVVAHSFGCRVAVKLASMQSGVFDKMVLTGPAGIIEKRGLAYRCKVKTYRIVRKIAPKFAEKRFGSKEYRSLSPVMRESYKKIVNEDLRACAKKVQNQVLIIQGKGDKTTPLSSARIYQNTFKNATLKVMDGGHFAFVENTTLFNLWTEEFLYG